MAEPATERTGVLVLRAWADAFIDDGFRARITSRLDVERSDDETQAAATIEGVLEIVREWLQTFRDAG